MNSEHINELLYLAQDLAKNAGSILFERKFELKQYKYDLKNIKEIKSLADQALNDSILSGLIPTGIPILTEESGLNENNSKSVYCWIVDPLDGTYNFVKDLGPSAISIALWKDNKPIFGVIYDIQSKILYWGGRSLGSYADGNIIRVSDTFNKSKSSVCTGFPARLNIQLDSEIIEYWQAIKGFSKIRMIGSAAISLVNVARGCSEAYMENNIMIWDVAAGLAIVEGSGGFVSQNKGTLPYSLNIKSANIDTMFTN